VTTSVAATTPAWERLHPLSPVVRGGRAVIVLLFAIVAATGGGSQNGARTRLPIDGALIAFALVAGLVHWLVTKWSFDGVTLRIETGLLRRDARQVPVARVQAVDVVEPLLARWFGLAELQITVAGAGKNARLSYLGRDRALQVRNALLAAHHGQHPATPEPVEVAGLAVPTDRLVGSVLLSLPALVFVLLVVGVVVVALSAPHGLGGAIGVLVAYMFSTGALVWRRFNVLYGFTVGYAADGIRIRRGLLGNVAETVPYRRVQAVRQIEPLMWRPFGWCRLEVDLAGMPGRDRGQGSGRVRKTLLPVGDRATAAAIRGAVVAEPGCEPTPPPARARLKAPLSFHFLRAGHDEHVAVAVTGRFRRRTCWVPLDKVQSVRRVQGPLQRRLRLATVHVDVPGRDVEAAFRDRDEQEAASLVDEIADRSRTARSRVGPEPRPPAAGAPAPATTSPTASSGPTAPGATSPPAGWYADPSGRHRHRYWSGSAWTEHVHDEGPTTAVDPL